MVSYWCVLGLKMRDFDRELKITDVGCQNIEQATNA